jgi:Tfp pilus assembly protein PilN
VIVESLRITPTNITVSGSTLSQSSFNLLITNLQLLPEFHNVSVDKVEARERNAPGFNFQIKADTKAVPRVTEVEEVEEEVNILDRTQGL